MYNIKNLINEARVAEKLAYGFDEQGETDFANKCIRKSIKLSGEAEELYFNKVGEYMDYRELRDLFGVE